MTPALLATKYLGSSWSLTMNGVPGVMLLESNLTSSGSYSPLSRAFFSLISASLADWNLLPRCWFNLAIGATRYTAMRNNWRIRGVEQQNVGISMALLAGITAFFTPTQSWHSTRTATWSTTWPTPEPRSMNFMSGVIGADSGLEQEPKR